MSVLGRTTGFPFLALAFGEAATFPIRFTLPKDDDHMSSASFTRMKIRKMLEKPFL